MGSTIVAPAVPGPPIYSSRFFKRNPVVRIARQMDMLGLQNARPFWIPIFDTLTLFPNGTIPANGSAENNFQLTADFAWLANIASVTPFVNLLPFTFQIFRSFTDAQGNQDTYAYQKTPVKGEGQFGKKVSALPGALLPILPVYFDKPVLLKAGTNLQCRVQNTNVNTAQTLQIVLFGYIEG